MTENPQGPELLNSRAVAVVTRVSNKLTGRDFNPRVTLDVPTQVEKLIQQATSLENLCQCYVGWYVLVSFSKGCLLNLSLLGVHSGNFHFVEATVIKTSILYQEDSLLRL